jgi:hypothetical protein
MLYLTYIPLALSALSPRLSTALPLVAPPLPTHSESLKPDSSPNRASTLLLPAGVECPSRSLVPPSSPGPRSSSQELINFQCSEFPLVRPQTIHLAAADTASSLNGHMEGCEYELTRVVPGPFPREALEIVKRFSDNTCGQFGH